MYYTGVILQGIGTWGHSRGHRRRHRAIGHRDLRMGKGAVGHKDGIRWHIGMGHWKVHRAIGVGIKGDYGGVGGHIEA